MTGSAPDPIGDHATDSPPRLPTWVKLLALGGAVVLAVLVMAMLLIGGDHSPGMHNG